MTVLQGWAAIVLLAGMLVTLTHLVLRTIRAEAATLGARIGELRGELTGHIDAQVGGLRGEIAGVRGEMTGLRGELHAGLDGLRSEMNARFDSVDRDVQRLYARVFHEEV